MSALSARRKNGNLWRWVGTRAAMVIALAVLATYAVVSVLAVLDNWYFFDARGYWEAGLRLREGGELYPALPDQDDPGVYRYAPWFAWLWAAFTFLPQEAVFVGWGALMAGACAYLLWQLPRNLLGLALALLFGAMLFRVLSQGNVQPLMVAGLAFGLQRRSGWAWVALAASLKLVPILFVLVYVAQRRWRRAALAMALTGLLWLPALAYGLGHYPMQVGGESFPFGPIVWVIAGASAVAVFLAPPRFRILAASLAVAFAGPRWIPYNPAYLLVATKR